MERGYNHDPEFTVMGEPRDRETNVYPLSLSASLLFTAVSVCVSASAPLSDPLCHVPALLSLSAPPPSLLFLIVSLSRAALYSAAVPACLFPSSSLSGPLLVTIRHVTFHYVCLCLSASHSLSGPLSVTFRLSTSLSVCVSPPSFLPLVRSMPHSRTLPLISCPSVSLPITSSICSSLCHFPALYDYYFICLFSLWSFLARSNTTVTTLLVCVSAPSPLSHSNPLSVTFQHYTFTISSVSLPLPVSRALASPLSRSGSKLLSLYLSVSVCPWSPLCHTF